MIAGGGAKGARESLISFSEAWGAGVYAAFRRQDVFPNEHPNYLGHLTLGTPLETLKTLEEADQVLVVGCRLSEITTQSYSLPCGDQAVRIQIDIDPNEVGATVSAEIGMTSGCGYGPGRVGRTGALVTPGARDWAEGHRPTSTPARYPRIEPGKASTPRGSSAPCAMPCLRTLY